MPRVPGHAHGVRRPLPVEDTDYEAQDALEASTTPPSTLSPDPLALGYGFRCGFLGMLHLRSSRSSSAQFNLSLIVRSERPLPRGDAAGQPSRSTSRQAAARGQDRADRGPYVRGPSCADGFMSEITNLGTSGRAQVPQCWASAAASVRFPLSEIVIDFCSSSPSRRATHRSTTIFEFRESLTW